MRLINPLPYAATPDTPLNSKVWPNIKRGGELTALVDADFLVYRCGFSIEHHNWCLFNPDGYQVAGPFKCRTDLKKWMEANGGEAQYEGWEKDDLLEIEDFSRAWMRMQTTKKRIMEVIGTKKNVWYLTKGSTLQRNKDATIQGYKANRVKNAKPAAYDYLREKLQTVMKAKIPVGIEADDAVAHLGRKYAGRVVIVSPDKDLATIPGLHLNPMNTAEGVVFISELIACRNLYGQMLSGDAVDNIRGLHGTVTSPGWSVNAAKKAMNECYTEGMCQAVVMKAYQERFPQGCINMNGEPMLWWEALLENANLLFLRGSPSMKFRMET